MLEQEKGRLDFSSSNHYIPVAVKYVLWASGILSEFLVNLGKSHGTTSDEFSICYKETKYALLDKTFWLRWETQLFFLNTEKFISEPEGVL